MQRYIYKYLFNNILYNLPLTFLGQYKVENIANESLHKLNRCQLYIIGRYYLLSDVFSSPWLVTVRVPDRFALFTPASPRRTYLTNRCAAHRGTGLL